MIPRQPLLEKLEKLIESAEALGFDVGRGEEVLDFLARVEMQVVEQLLGNGLTVTEREQVLNWIEERKGQLPDDELPHSEATRRVEHRRSVMRPRRRQ